MLWHLQVARYGKRLSEVKLSSRRMVTSPSGELEMELASACFGLAEIVSETEDASSCGGSEDQGGRSPLTADLPNLHYSPGSAGSVIGIWRKRWPHTTRPILPTVPLGLQRMPGDNGMRRGYSVRNRAHSRHNPHHPRHHGQQQQHHCYSRSNYYQLSSLSFYHYCQFYHVSQS